MKLTAPTTDANQTCDQLAHQADEPTVVNGGSTWDSLLGEDFHEDEAGPEEEAVDAGEQTTEETTDGTTLDEDQENAPQAVVDPWPTDPRIDHETGVYQDGWTEIVVPTRKRSMSNILVTVIQTQDGTWQAGWFAEHGENDTNIEHDCPLKVDCEQWATAELAIADAADQADSYFALHVENEKLAASVRDDLAKFKAAVESGEWKLPAADGVEEATAEATAETTEQPADTTPEPTPETPTAQPTDSLPSIDALDRIRSAQDEVDSLHAEWQDLKEETKEAKKRWEVAVKRQGELIKELTTPLPLFDGGKPPAPQPGVEAKPEESPALPDGAIGTKRVEILSDLTLSHDIEGHRTTTLAVAGDVVEAFVSSVENELFIIHNDIRWNLDSEEYAELPDDGNESLDTTATVATEAKPTSTSAAQAVDQDFWRKTTIEQLGLSEGICKILHEDNSVHTLGDITDWTAAHVNSPNPLLDLKKVGQAKADKIEQAIADYWKSVGSN